MSNPGCIKLESTYLADLGHIPVGGFPLTKVSAKHSMQLQPSSVQSKGCDSAILWPHSVLWCIAVTI